VVCPATEAGDVAVSLSKADELVSKAEVDTASKLDDDDTWSNAEDVVWPP
jgi:hypothetical protein